MAPRASKRRNKTIEEAAATPSSSPSASTSTSTSTSIVPPLVASTSAIPDHEHQYDHDPALGIDVCIICGDVSSSSSSTQLHALGRTAEDETIERGRRYLANMTGYVGDRPMLKGQTLKGLGVERNIYHEMKMNDIKRFIRSVLAHFEIFGLYARVKSLFTSAKQVNNFKWGKRAKAIAVACVYIAAKEVKRSLRLVDLCSVLDIDYHLLTRLQNSLKTWLNLSVSTYEPVIFLESHLVHLSSVVRSSLSSALPPPNLSGGRWSPAALAYLRQVDWIKVRSLATSLLDFIADLHLALQRSPEHVACAIVVIAIEGSLRTKIKNAKELFDDLANRVEISTKSVQSRYREVYAALTDYARRLPWDAGLGEGKKGDVARVVEDVVKYRRMLESRTAKPVLKEVEEGEDGWQEEGTPEEGPAPVGQGEGEQEEAEEDDSDVLDDLAPDPLQTTRRVRASESIPPPPRIKDSATPTLELAPTAPSSSLPNSRQYLPPSDRNLGMTSKKRSRTLENVAQSLKLSFDDSSPKEGGSPTASTTLGSAYAPHHSASIRLRQLLLSGADASLYLDHRRTRLSAQDGGLFDAVEQEDRERETTRLDRLLWDKSVDEIGDDELFEEGEMEAFLREKEEVEKLKRTRWFEEMPEMKEGEGGGRRKHSKRKRKVKDETGKEEDEEGEEGWQFGGGRKRSKMDLVDKAVLERLLEQEGEDEDQEDGDGFERALLWQSAVEEAIPSDP